VHNKKGLSRGKGWFGGRPSVRGGAQAACAGRADGLARARDAVASCQDRPEAYHGSSAEHIHKPQEAAPWWTLRGYGLIWLNAAELAAIGRYALAPTTSSRFTRCRMGGPGAGQRGSVPALLGAAHRAAWSARRQGLRGRCARAAD